MTTFEETDSEWVHKEPSSVRPHFSKVNKDIQCKDCIVGHGIFGILTAYELVTCELTVTIIEAREVLPGELGKTVGSLSSTLHV